jgi:cytoskeletal protein CcmA (bactofilin family)
MWKRDQSVTPPVAPPGGHHDQSGDPAPPESRPPAESRATDTLVMDLGKSMVIKGELSGSEDLTLYGQMEGSIMLPDHTLTIGPDADIRAQVVARFVVIMGAVTGNVTAGEKVEIQATGSVTGDIASPRLVIVDGARFRGSVEMQDILTSRHP